MSKISKERLAIISDSDLQAEIDLNKIKRNSLEQSLKWLHEEDNAYQAELDRRALDAYWQAHPELLRLEVGDKLIITKKLLQHRDESGGWPNSKRSRYIGDVCEIAAIRKYGDEWFADIDTNYGYTGIIPLEVIQDMRRAYLSQQGETT